MFPCEIQHRAEQPTLVIHFRASVQDLPHHFQRIFGTIGRYIGEHGAQYAGAPFAAYYNMDMQNLEVEAGFPVTRPVAGSGEIQAGVIPAGTYALCHYTGSYSGVGPAYGELIEFARLNGYQPGGASYECYFSGPEVPPDKTRTDILIQVEPIREHHPGV